MAKKKSQTGGMPVRDKAAATSFGSLIPHEEEPKKKPARKKTAKKKPVQKKVTKKTGAKKPVAAARSPKPTAGKHASVPEKSTKKAPARSKKKKKAQTGGMLQKAARGHAAASPMPARSGVASSTISHSPAVVSPSFLSVDRSRDIFEQFFQSFRSGDLDRAMVPYARNCRMDVTGFDPVQGDLAVHTILSNISTAFYSGDWKQEKVTVDAESLVAELSWSGPFVRTFGRFPAVHRPLTLNTVHRMEFDSEGAIVRHVIYLDEMKLAESTGLLPNIRTEWGRFCLMLIKPFTALGKLFSR